VIKQLDSLVERDLIRRHGSHGMPPSRFLDLGTGNGHMLFRLRQPEDDDEEAWLGDMVGVDYSEASVSLARKIAEQRRDEQGDPGALRFECWDLLEAAAGDWLGDGFDIVLDKGTFDAISLMGSQNEPTHPCQRYRQRVAPLVRPGCFLIVTSCNWTKDELRNWLAPSDSEFAYFDEARYPTFTFGGQTGQSIVTLVFQRKGGS
jgi:EEF1A lysine methyltransferase 2